MLNLRYFSAKMGAKIKFPIRIEPLADYGKGSTYNSLINIPRKSYIAGKSVTACVLLIIYKKITEKLQSLVLLDYKMPKKMVFRY